MNPELLTQILSDPHLSQIFYEGLNDGIVDRFNLEKEAGIKDVVRKVFIKSKPRSNEIDELAEKFMARIGKTPPKVKSVPVSWGYSSGKPKVPIKK